MTKTQPNPDDISVIGWRNVKVSPIGDRFYVSAETKDGRRFGGTFSKWGDREIAVLRKVWERESQ